MSSRHFILSTMSLLALGTSRRGRLYIPTSTIRLPVRWKCVKCLRISAGGDRRRLHGALRPRAGAQGSAVGRHSPRNEGDGNVRRYGDRYFHGSQRIGRPPGEDCRQPVGRYCLSGNAYALAARIRYLFHFPACSLDCSLEIFGIGLYVPLGTATCGFRIPLLDCIKNTPVRLGNELSDVG